MIKKLEEQLEYLKEARAIAAEVQTAQKTHNLDVDYIDGAIGVVNQRIAYLKQQGATEKPVLSLASKDESFVKAINELLKNSKAELTSIVESLNADQERIEKINIPANATKEQIAEAILKATQTAVTP